MPVRYQSTHASGSTLLAVAALVVTWALVHASLVVFRDVPVFESGLIGPDSYMHMLRVSELAQGWQWFDNTIARANAPYGDVLHWTRPFDLLILLLALPAGLALEAEQALYLAGMIVSPLMQLATALLLIWALRPVIRPEVWFLPAVALFLQPGALAYSLLGRADHHALLLLVFVAVAGFMLRALRNPLDARSALCAGLAAGFGIWLSVEFLLVAGLSLTALGLPWLSGERERAAQGKWYALGISIVLLLALFAERPLENLLEASYDSVSSVHYLLAVAILLFWRTAETFEARSGRPSRFLGRATLGVVGAGSIGLLLVAIYPLFFAGPLVEVDPRIVPLWLDRVTEMLPLIPTDRHSFGRFVFYLGGTALVLPLFLKVMVEERGSPRFHCYLFIVLACLFLTLVGVSHVRFSGYAEFAAVFAFAVVLDRFLRWSGRIASDLLRGLLRGGFIGAMLMGPLLVGGTLMTKPAVATDAAGQPLNGCSVRQVADYLENDPRWGSAPQTVLAFMDIGPELLYRTRHHVIGTPYHRNGNGIYDGWRMLASTDGAAARALAEQRGIDLVLLCRTPSERHFYTAADGEENLYSRLEEGNPPDWLTAVELPPAIADEARLYRVVR
jgi:hypothetical protein